MYFPTTQWTLLARASLTGESAAGQALEELCRRYWSPLYQFIRARGYRETEAEDLTQGFVLHLLEHSTLKKADRDKGRFRSFLLGALTRFLADEYDRRRAQKRGDGAVHVSMDERSDAMDDHALESSCLASEVLFDREWALVVLENALRAVQEEFKAQRGVAQFAVLRLFLPGSLESPTYEAAAAQLGLSVPAFKSELHRLRRRLKELVRQEVASTVSVPHEIEEEMEHLQRVLMDRGSNLSREAKPSDVNS
jgi:RNA polymerase sigma factor (sigma-70 family)